MIANLLVCAIALIQVASGQVAPPPPKDVANCTKYSDVEPKVDVATNTKICTECLSGTFLNANECKPCHKTCVTCTGSATNCLSCGAAQYLGPQVSRVLSHSLGQQVAKTCLPCQTGCSTCTDGLTCLQCYTQFMKHPVTSKCVACTTGCKQCNTDAEVCEVAMNRYYIDSATKKCASCISNCEECTGPADCKTCISGYEPKTENGKLSCVMNSATKTFLYIILGLGLLSVLACAFVIYQNNCKGKSSSAPKENYDSFAADK